ncbi:DNA-binding protein [Streptomyces sp. A0958]|nr:DNA-binding protein [Streptomyces sp. A0958]
MVTDNGYPKGLLRVPTVAMEDWISQHEAARILGISVGRIGMLISTGHLAPAHSPTGEAGVTKISLREEADWRKSATIFGKMHRILKDSIKFL